MMPGGVWKGLLAVKPWGECDAERKEKTGEEDAE